MERIFNKRLKIIMILYFVFLVLLLYWIFQNAKVDQNSNPPTALPEESLLEECRAELRKFQEAPILYEDENYKAIKIEK